jgi:hypothetical protein
MPVAGIKILGKVAGFEDVQVPAGNFYCAKIDLTGDGFLINFQNPLEPYRFSFPGNLWMNRETGIVKTIFSAPLAELIQNLAQFDSLFQTINIQDSLRVIKQELLYYKIRD